MAVRLKTFKGLEAAWRCSFPILIPQRVRSWPLVSSEALGKNSWVLWCQRPWAYASKFRGSPAECCSHSKCSHKQQLPNSKLKCQEVSYPKESTLWQLTLKSLTSSFDVLIVFLLEYVRNSQTCELKLPIWGGKADRNLCLNPLSVISRGDTQLWNFSVFTFPFWRASIRVLGMNS